MADFASKLRENPETAVNRSLLAYGFGYDIRIRSIERALFDYGRRRTPHHILRIVFRHRAWRIVDLVGPSGAGKSSLLTAFARLNPRASGDLRLDGRSADDFTPQQWRAQVAYLPQKPVLLGETVAQAIRLPFTLAIRQSARTKQGPRRISPTDALPDGRIRETLDNMGCADIDLNRPPHDLSGGQAARVSLARTLLTRPKVLLADEVDAGLDDDNAEKVARILAKAAADGMAIVRIRHRPPDGHATRVTRLADGTLTQSGNAEADGTATGSTSTGNTVEGSVA